MEKFGGYDFFNGWNLDLWRKIDTHCLINVLIIRDYVRRLSVHLFMFYEVTIFVNTYATSDRKKKCKCIFRCKSMFIVETK